MKIRLSALQQLMLLMISIPVGGIVGIAILIFLPFWLSVSIMLASLVAVFLWAGEEGDDH